MHGVRLILLHPEVAGRSCLDCRRWLYDDAGRVLTRAGKPVPRPANTRTPCGTCPKIPKGLPADPLYAVDVTTETVKTFLHYRECRAVGQFPDDPLVRRSAGVIRAVEDSIERERGQQELLLTLGTITRG